MKKILMFLMLAKNTLELSSIGAWTKIIEKRPNDEAKNGSGQTKEGVS